MAPRVCRVREIYTPCVSKLMNFTCCDFVSGLSVFIPSLSLPWVSIGLLVLAFLLVSSVTGPGRMPLSGL